MNEEWKQLCKAPHLKCLENTVEVQFDSGRGQEVAVTDTGESFLLFSVVVRQARVETMEDLPEKIGLRNRTLQLVGFRIDERGRLIGEVWVPKAGLTTEEFQIYLHAVATECDRFEYQLTGRDFE